MEIGNNLNNFYTNNINNSKPIRTTDVKKDTQAKDTVVLSNKKKKLIKAGIAAGLASLAIGLAIWKKKKAINEVPKDLKNLFKSIKNKKGKEFVDEAYNGLVKHMGLEDIAPKGVEITKNPDRAFNRIMGGYTFNDNKISYTQGFINKLSKSQQVSLLRHELEHCSQYNKILRTEGLGAEKLAETLVEKSVSTPNFFGKIYKDEVFKHFPKEQAEKELQETKKKYFDEIIEQLKSAHKTTLELPKYKPDSKEGKQAYEYLKATKEYEGLGFFGFGSDKYRENLLEKEAYAAGEKCAKLYNAVTSPINKIKDVLRLCLNEFKSKT